MTLTWEQADRAALDKWLELHLVARRADSDQAATALADVALAHILPLAAELPEEPPFVGVHNPTRPTPATLTPWIEAVEAAEDPGTLLANGVELGLLGLDDEVDRRAAHVIVDHFEQVQPAMEGITRQALLDPLVARIVEDLAETVEHDEGRRAALRDLCRRVPAAYNALGAVAGRHRSLTVTKVYLWAMVDRDPSRRPSAARTLLMLDASADVRALWGEQGPVAKEEHAALLSTYHEAEREPPEQDLQRALAALMTTSLDEVDRGDPLALAIRGLPDHLELPEYCCWYAAARPPGAGQRLDAWARIVARALAAKAVPAERAAELMVIAARQFIAPKTLDGYFEAIERLRKATPSFDKALIGALEDVLHESDDADPTELIAMMFTIWSKAPDHGLELHDRVLAPAARPYREQDDRIRSHLGPRRMAEWDEFAARHARRRFARVRARFSRRGR